MTTPDPSVLLDLAERCERATGPDRELDALIWCAVFAPTGSYVERSRFNGEWCIYLGVDRKSEAALWSYGKRRPQPVTGSIDAGMMLVPEGFWTTLRVCKNKDSERAYCHATLECDADTMERDLPDDFDFTYEAKNCISGALALCAAALRARSTDTVQGE